MAPVDAYEVPDRHRETVHLRKPADCLPYSSNTSRDADVDHTVGHVAPGKGGVPGQSRLGTYGPLIRFHHRIKTHCGAWEVRQPLPGIDIWRTPMDQYYLVDHTGTRRISDPERAPTTGAPETGRRPKRHHPDLAIAMHFDRPTIDYENPHAA